MDAAEQVRRLVPARAVPLLVERRLRRLWADPAFRAAQERQMRFLLGRTERADEVPELARGFAAATMTRMWLSWHPGAVTRSRVEGVEWLTTKRDLERPTILSFMHHHHYHGLFASLRRLGAELNVLALADALAPEAPAYLRQQMRLVAMGSTMLPTGGGTQAVLDTLRPGMVMAIASDVPGQTEVEFLGRRVLGSFGAARIATLTDSPVVLARWERDAHGPYVQVDPPLEPSHFGSARELLHEMLRRHGESVLAWPEALDGPVARWGHLEPVD